MVQNGFVTRSSGHSSGSDSRSFGGQSSMQSIPEGKPDQADINPFTLPCRKCLKLGIGNVLLSLPHARRDPTVTWQRLGAAPSLNHHL